MNRDPISDLEWEIIEKLKRASQRAASAGKRFVRILNRQSRMSDAGRHFLAQLFWTYRRQYKITDEENLWLKQWADEARKGSGCDDSRARLAEWEKLYGRS